MPVSMTPYRVFDSYRSIDPAFFTRHGIRLLLCDLDYTLAPKSQPEPDADLRRWLSDVRAAGVEVMILSNNRRRFAATWASPMWATPKSRSRRASAGPWLRPGQIPPTRPCWGISC